MTLKLDFFSPRLFFLGVNTCSSYCPIKNISVHFFNICWRFLLPLW